jgi:hypothetical protein
LQKHIMLLNFAGSITNKPEERLRQVTHVRTAPKFTLGLLADLCVVGAPLARGILIVQFAKDQRHRRLAAGTGAPNPPQFMGADNSRRPRPIVLAAIPGAIHGRNAAIPRRDDPPAGSSRNRGTDQKTLLDCLDVNHSHKIWHFCRPGNPTFAAVQIPIRLFSAGP